MKITPIKTPVLAKIIFSSYIWEIPSESKTLYLTFDDGPTPEITNWTLDILDKYKAIATFFCIGKNVSQHPEIFKNIQDKGHKIGNHTHNHIKGWRTSTKNYIANIKEAQKVIDLQQNKTDSRSQILFRPPYGQIRPKQGKALTELGYKVIMWNVLAFDWDKDVTKEKCLENVISNAKEGSVIVFHDSVKAEKNMRYTLPKVLELFSKKGYTFKSIEI